MTKRSLSSRSCTRDGSHVAGYVISRCPYRQADIDLSGLRKMSAEGCSSIPVMDLKEKKKNKNHNAGMNSLIYSRFLLCVENSHF